MGLIEQELLELRQMLKDLEGGKIDGEMVDRKISIYSQSEKRSSMMLKKMIMKERAGIDIEELENKSNLMLDGTSLLSKDDLELESIKCPVKNMIIVRHDCLDFSEDIKNYGKCKGCINFKITRDKLLPGK
ncbi:hypothetical protein KAR91_31205 [Candidatus Pacearchaeota archaeon]|nr:hypothetical protein [Candidatus Pacearchaeota archaeon]